MIMDWLAWNWPALVCVAMFAIILYRVLLIGEAIDRMAPRPPIRVRRRR